MCISASSLGISQVGLSNWKGFYMKPMFLRKSPPNTTPTNGEPARAQDVADLACRQTGSPTDPTTLFTTTRDKGIVYVDDYLQALSANLRKQEFATLAALWDELADLPYHVGVVASADFALQHVSAKTPDSTAEIEPAVPEYIISARFLTQCHTYLIGDTQGFERMHLVTGLELSDNRYTLDHMEKVALSHQSVGGAQADQRALQHALIEMDTFGSHLLGLFHSHPGSGPGATRPSHIDFATHKRYEDGGYPLIGAIFVPGFVRFFSANKLFSVTIYGKGVEQVAGDTHVYKIQHPETRVVSYETSETQDEGRGDS
jgi:hypothetical protein